VRAEKDEGKINTNIYLQDNSNRYRQAELGSHTPNTTENGQRLTEQKGITYNHK